MTTAEADTSKALQYLGFSLRILSGPSGQVGESDWPCIAYEVEVLYGDKQILKTAFKMGVGHVSTKRAPFMSDLLTGDEQSLLYTWQSKPHAQFKDKKLWASVAAKLARHQKVVPSLASVLHSLMTDGEPFFNASSFEDWCADFGYDPDSRKAESIYRTCDNIGRQLASGVPKEALAAARNILADY